MTRTATVVLASMTGLWLAASVSPALDPGAGVSAAGQRVTAAPELFADIEGSGLLLPEGARVRRRVRRVNEQALSALTRSDVTAPSLTLSLFPNVAFTALFDRVEETRPGRVWVGRIPKEPLSMVSLAIVDEALSGHISYLGGMYEIEGEVNGTAVVSEIDVELLPREAPPVRPPRQRVADAGDPDTASVTAAAERPVINLAVFYTPPARRYAGGTSHILARIFGAVARTNQAYRNSFIRQRLQTVYVGEVGGDIEPREFDLVLRYLRQTDDGYLDGVHKIRDREKADLVTLIMSEDPEWCGIAYNLGPPFDDDMAKYAFSVIFLTCVPTFMFSDILGHNMGGGHDWYVDDWTYGWTYSHGYVDLGGRFFTVMGSITKCLDAGVRCNWVGYFSNPRLTYRGRPMGVPAGTRLNCKPGRINSHRCDADNSATLNRSGSGVAKFR